MSAANAGSARSRKVLIGLTVGYLSVLLFAPLAALVGRAFSEGLWSFAWALAGPGVWSAVGLSLVLAFGAVIVNGVAGTAAAWVLARHRFPGRKFLIALVDMPFAVPPVVAGYMLILIFGREGYLRKGINGLDLHVLFSRTGMLLATVFVTFPFVVRALLPLLQAFGRDQEEAAATLGAGPWDIFRRAAFPGLRWALLYGAGLTLAAGLGEFGAVCVAGGGLRGSEAAAFFISRVMDERMTVAAGAVSLVLAGVSFLFVAAGEAVLRGIQEKRSRPAGPSGEDDEFLDAFPEETEP